MNANGGKPKINGNGNRKLTHKQEVFVQEYLRCWNASEAARRAGYSCPRQSGSETLSKLYIQNRIKERMDEISMTADEALMRLSQTARWDPGNYITINEDTGNPEVDVQRIIDDKFSFMIKGIRPTAHGTIVEFHDAQAAAKHIDQRDKELRIRMQASVVVSSPDWMFPDIEELSEEEVDDLYADIFGSDDDNNDQEG